MDIDLTTTMCVTGRRPQKIPGYWLDPRIPALLQGKLLDYIQKAYRQGYRTFISGMALGVDQDFAAMVISYREQQAPDIKLVAAVPCGGQDRMWPSTSKRRYAALLEQANYVHFVSREAYAPWRMHQRDRWMIDHSGLVLAAWDYIPSGGTGRAVQYAQHLERPIWYLDTRELEVITV